MSNEADGLRIGLTESSAALNGHKVGEIHVDSNGYEYRLVLMDPTLTGDATAAGQVVYIKTPSTWVCTNTVAGGLNATYPQVVGVSMGAVTEGEYGWVMRKGYHATVKTDGGDDIVAGVDLIPGGNGTCNSLPGDATDTTDGIISSIFAIAAADDNNDNDTVAALIDCRI